MPYPPRLQLRPIREIADSVRTGRPASDGLQACVEALIVDAYRAGRSLREVAELVGRSQTAVRRALDKHSLSVPRRPSGAPAMPRAARTDGREGPG